MTNSAPLPEETEETPIVWLHPRAWKTDNRTRSYITLPERHWSREGDLDTLCRTVVHALKLQDARGSFLADAELCCGDKGDDHLGYAALLAYYLTRRGPDEAVREALERALRFYLDCLVFRSPDRTGAFTRSVLSADTPGDWCNTLWCLGHGATILRYSAARLSPRTAEDLRAAMAECWRFVSTFPTRDENPCHNQLLGYCEIGINVGAAIGEPAIQPEVLDYYHQHLRRRRIQDRGHTIYSEFGQWDIHYGTLSWFFLEVLFAQTGDPVIRADADEMATYFHEQVSAAGYCWGGSRNNECGVDEFPQLFTARTAELDLDGLLFPEPSHLWNRTVVDGHGGSGLVGRIESNFMSRPERRKLPPTPWHFRSGEVSVCLQDDTKMHHVSAAGLELISVPTPGGVAPGLRWLPKGGAWKEDRLQTHPPRASEGLKYCDSQPIQADGVAGITSMQRGYYWETRQWWLGDGRRLLWIGQLITHFPPECEGVDFVLANPVLTRVAGRPTPVSEVESAEGVRADTQGEPVTVGTAEFLRFGDVMMGGTAPLEFVRPSREAFHTFPTPGRFWRDFDRSNEIRVAVDRTPRRLDTRESLFFAVEIGREAPRLETAGAPREWTLRSLLGSFVARQSEGIWRYTLESQSAEQELPYVGFGYRA